MRAELQHGLRVPLHPAAANFRAPGRVNLIGEHTDYNDGFVMPVAIGFATWAAVAPRTDRQLVVHSENFGETCEFDLDHPPGSRGHWSDYVLGVAVMLQRSGLPVCGANLLIRSQVPIGAGFELLGGARSIRGAGARA